MDQNSRNSEEVEIDLGRYVRLIFKHKITFFAVLLLTLAIGFTNYKLSPKIYRSSMMIQPPVIGSALTGANDLESAESLKGLIVNNAFKEQIGKRLKLDPANDFFAFQVIIPPITNILQVSVDLESKKKKFGVVLLKNLNILIFESYAKRIDAEFADINSHIKFNEREIVSAKEKVKNLQEQIKEIINRKDKLMEETKLVKKNTDDILAKREGLTDVNEIDGVTRNASILLLSNFLQNNSSYLNQLNNQFSDLNIREININLELKNISSKISDFQMNIDKLKIRNGFVLNVKTISKPRVSLVPINSMGKKKIAILIAMGMFFGLLAVFLQGFWVNNLGKK